MFIYFRGEPILLYVVRVTARHLTEQKQRNVDSNQAQLKRRRMLHTLKGDQGSSDRCTARIDGPDDGELEIWGVMEAVLECLTLDWPTVRAAIMCGTEKPQ